MKTILIIDTETRTLDADADSVVEVAMTLFSVEHTQAIRSTSFLVRPEVADCKEWRKTQRIHGIKHELALERGVNRSVAAGLVAGWMREADACVAHNAKFDEAHVAALLGDEMPDTLWLDSIHFPWPQPSSRMDLASVALAHNIVTVDPHRAMPDVDVLTRLIRSAVDMGADLLSMLEYAAIPRETWAILREGELTDDARELQRELRFYWDRDRKLACRELSDDEAEEIQEVHGLRLVRLLEWEAWPTYMARPSYNSPEHKDVKAVGWKWHASDKTWRAKLDPKTVVDGVAPLGSGGIMVWEVQGE